MEKVVARWYNHYQLGQRTAWKSGEAYERFQRPAEFGFQMVDSENVSRIPSTV
jgi:hypothetical protein